LPDNSNIELLKSELLKRQIFVSFRGNYIRVSSHLYNTKEDFTQLVNCIKAIIK